MAVVACGLWPPLARAAGDAEAGAANKAAAQALLLEGNTLLQKGQGVDALGKFTEARRLFPSPKIYYNIGQAHGAIPGHEAQTYEAMSRFLNDAKDASPDLRNAAEVQRRTARLKVGLVFVTADPPDAAVLLDEADSGPPADAPFVLPIGSHRLMLRKGAATSTAETITVAGGEVFKLQLRLPPTPLAVAPAQPPPLVVAPTPPGATVATMIASPPQSVPVDASGVGTWNWQRVTGASLLGLGAASLVLGVIEHVRYFGKADDFTNAGCGTTDLTARSGCASLKSQFDSAHNWLIAGYVGAAVLGGAGAYLLWIAPASPAHADGRSMTSTSPGLAAGFQGRF